MHSNITEVAEIEVRGEAVELEGLRARGGSKASVWVVPMDALDTARILKTWGALSPAVGPAEQRQVDVIENIQTISRPLIETCVKVKRDGVLVQAFSWSGDSVLPPNQLTATDLANLTACVIRLSGMAPEDEKGAGFPDGEPRGLADGGGTDEPGPEHGPDAVAGV